MNEDHHFHILLTLVKTQLHPHHPILLLQSHFIVLFLERLQLHVELAMIGLKSQHQQVAPVVAAAAAAVVVDVARLDVRFLVSHQRVDPQEED